MRCSIAFIASLLVAPVAVGSTLASRPAAAHVSLDPEQLLQRFKKVQGLEAKYREEKRMALLVDPLVSEGSIYYARPGKLARHQTTPERVSVIITEDALEFGGAHGKESVNLAQNPVIRLFVDSFVDVLAGDRKALERNYTLGFEDLGKDRWKLGLKPKVAPINTMIEGISMVGVGVTLESMEIIEVGGDSTRMTFTGVNPRRSYTGKEQREIFRVHK